MNVSGLSSFHTLFPGWNFSSNCVSFSNCFCFIYFIKSCVVCSGILGLVFQAPWWSFRDSLHFPQTSLAWYRYSHSTHISYLHPRLLFFNLNSCNSTFKIRTSCAVACDVCCLAPILSLRIFTSLIILHFLHSNSVYRILTLYSTIPFTI